MFHRCALSWLLVFIARVDTRRVASELAPKVLQGGSASPLALRAHAGLARRWVARSFGSRLPRRVTVTSSAIVGGVTAMCRRCRLSPRCRRSLRRASSEALELDDVSLALRGALQRFEQEISDVDDDINVLQAAALLALHADPFLDVDAAVLRPLARLGDGFRAELDSANAAAATLDGDDKGLALLPESVRLHRRAYALCAYMEAQGFRGCPRTEDGYYNASNSCLDRVLEERTGLPISLALIYMEVGRAGGLELRPMAMPGHFLLSFGSNESASFLDAFTNQVLTDDETADFFSELYGKTVRMDPSWRTVPPLPKVIFLTRVVMNLMNAYKRRSNLAMAARATGYFKILEVAAGRRGWKFT